jgi:uncharacterized protein YdhG (YjbR/CyaY superfamily)
MPANPLTVTDYIDQYPPDIKEILSNIRKIIKKTLPNSEESIKYGMPAYYVNGHPFVNFGAHKNHIGLYGSIPEICKEKLKDYECTKGGIQFPYKEPIPYTLIREIITYKNKEYSYTLQESKT